MTSRSPTSESGLISVGAVIGIAFAALVVYLLLAAFDGDSDYYGSVAIPSQNARVELPNGEVDMYLEAEGDPDALGAISPPEDLSITIIPAEGNDDGPVTTDDRGGDTEEVDGGAARLIRVAQVPEEGAYFVTVTADSVGSPSGLSLTFGLTPIGAVRERFEDVVDELNGPTGIVVLAALGLLFLAPRFQRALRR